MAAGFRRRTPRSGAPGPSAGDSLAREQRRQLVDVGRGEAVRTTFAIYERDLRNHLLPGLGDVPIQQLDGSTLTRHYAQLLDRLSAKTVANVHGLAHRILEDAVDDELLLRNPAARADKPKAEDEERPTWTPEQVVRFLRHVRDDDPDWHALYATMAATGIRRGEAVGATWAAVDLHAGTLEIRQTITKAGSKIVTKKPKSKRSRRTVPLPPAVVSLLLEHRRRQGERRLMLGEVWEDGDLIFANAWGRYVYPDYVSTKFARYAEQCGLPHIGVPTASVTRSRPHSTRTGTASPRSARSWATHPPR